MDPMSVLEVVGGEIDQIDAVFEFWLASSFAVGVAIHAVRETVIFRLKIFLAGLYGVLSLIAILHTIGDFLQISYYLSLLDPEVIDMSQIANPPGLAASLLRVSLLLVGSISIMVFIFKYDSWYKSEGNT